MRRVAAPLVLSLLLCMLPAPLAAQTPTFREVVGHDFGERITLHSQMVRYLERLAETSPRVRVERQGHSWQGRELLLAIVTAPENHARLDEIRRNAQRLADPRRTSPAEAQAILAGQPAIVWFGGSIHGFELSGSEGVLKLLEHLSTRDDAATLEVLRNTVVLIDPILNPDGRDAFAGYNHAALGQRPSPEPEDWANDFTSWQALGFRTSHYFFDINRDWFAHTHPETRERIPTFLAWRPQVAVDAHEMGPEVEFYFDPPGAPVNPFFPEHSTRWFERFGAAHAAAFDRAGFEYMTGERYNFFYPGYTTAYTNYQGAVGMLYEQGSSRGLALRRPDGSVRTLADALEQQYTAAWAALSLAAREREALLRDYYESHRQALADGGRGVRRYLIAPDEGDPGHVAELVNLLQRNGIEVQRTTEPVRVGELRDRTGARVGARTFPAGTYVVEAAQPRNRLIRVLLEPSIPVPEDFLREARARVERDENPRFYDITAWSLPLLFDVGGYGSADGRRLPVEPVLGEVRATQAPAGRPGYAYLLDGRQAAAVGALYHLLDAGHRAAVTLKPTRLGGEPVASGTVVVRVGQNEESVHEAVRAVAERFGLRVRAADTGLGDPGFPALGSGDVIAVRLPRIALLAEDPVQGYSFGWAWYTLDRAYGIPVTVLRTRSLGTAALNRFDVLVLPELSGSALGRLLGEEGIARLKQWVQDGGTLVAIGSATDFAREQLGLLRLRSWYDTEAGKNAPRVSVPGAIVRARLDPEYWLTAGYGDAELPVLVNSNRVYLRPEGPPSSGRRTVATYAPARELVLAGHLWPESRERLPESVAVYEERAGRGRVIAFAEDPNFRGYWRGPARLFLNAVVLGPSAP